MFALLALLLAAPTPATKCQAVVNLEGGDHLLVTIDDAPAIVRGSGWIAHDGAAFWSVFSVDHEAKKQSPHGKLSVTWRELFVQSLAGGVPLRLEGADPGLAAPGPDDYGLDWYLDAGVTVTSIIGPFVSLSIGAGGFTGGAHELDDAASAIHDLRKPQDRLSLVAVIGARFAKPFELAVAAAAKDYLDGGGIGSEPSFDADTGAVLAFEGGKLMAQSTLDCCTWVENHNHVWVSAEVPTMPTALSRFGGLDKTGFVAPDGCGALALSPTGVSVTRVSTTTTLPYPTGVKAKLIGVTWLAKPLPAVDLGNAVRTWSDPSDDLTAAIKATKDKDYVTAVDRFRAVLAVEPLNTKAAAGLGYALYLAKDYRASVAASRMALAFDPDDAQRGAIGYNLGMALEALGDKAGARAAYTDSLAARPNATVQKRLDAID